MNKFFNLALTFVITLFVSNVFAQTTPLIDGQSNVNINGVNGHTVQFNVSGCATGYDWTATNAQGQTFDLSADWDVAYGPSSTTSITTVPLGNIPGGLWLQDPKSTYQYSVQCVGHTGANDPKAKIDIYVLPQPVNELVPTIRTLSRECASVENGTGGFLRLQAVGCYDEVQWTKPDGSTETVYQEFDGILTLSGDYQDGYYTAKCKFNRISTDASYTPVTTFPVTQVGSQLINKEYYPPSTVRLTSPAGLGDGSWTEICDGTSINLNVNLASAYNDKLNYQWFFNNAPIDGNRTGVLKVGGTGSYFVRVSSKGGPGYCGFTDSNNFSINKIVLNKPVILGNSKYCLDDVTKLSVDSLSLVKNEGYLMPSKPTAPTSFTWYYNGIAQANLGTLSSIKTNTNVSVQVSYTTNYGCVSGLSDTLVVSNYDRPATPSITAKTKLGWCYGTPIEAILESSDIEGAATKYEWSNLLATKTVTIDKAGDYTVRVINTDGCYSLASAPVSITILPLPAAPSIATVNAASPFFCVKSESGTLNSVSLIATTTNDVIWSTKFEGKILADVKTSGNYTATARDLNGCISLNSNVIKVVAQPNPALASDTKILKEGVYTLKATNFPSAATVNATGAGEYVWKFGSTLLNPKTYITKVKTAGDYTVARKYLYTIDGTPLTCITDAVKYTYVVDPDYSGVAVYPNPITATSSTDLSAKVQIQILEDWVNGEITLFDMVGRPVYSGKIANTDGTSIVEVSGLANGIYILQIKADGGKSFVSKVIVNK